jgi:hypothetical protein
MYNQRVCNNHTYHRPRAHGHICTEGQAACVRACLQSLLSPPCALDEMKLAHRIGIDEAAMGAHRAEQSGVWAACPIMGYICIQWDTVYVSHYCILLCDSRAECGHTHTERAQRGATVVWPCVAVFSDRSHGRSHGACSHITPCNLDSNMCRRRTTARQLITMTDHTQSCC